MSDNQKIKQTFVEWSTFPRWLCVEDVIRYGRIKQGSQSVGRYLRRLEESGFVNGRLRDGKLYKEYHLSKREIRRIK